MEITVNQHQLLQTIIALFPSGKPLYVSGPPGVGKSEIFAQAARILGIGFFHFFGLFREPEDLNGVPFVREGRTAWAPPEFIPSQGEGIFFMDELPQYESAMQKAAARVLHERIVGDTPLPEGWVVHAAGNDQSHRAGATRLMSHVENRVIQLRMECAVQPWLSWAAGNNVDGRVISFINMRPSHLFRFDPKSKDASATPRSWTNLSKTIPHLQDATLRLPVFSGLVGPGIASEFMAYCEVYDKMPDVNLMLAYPDTCQIPGRSEISILWAISGAITERARDKSLIPNVATLGKRLPREISAATLLGVYSAHVKTNKDGTKSADKCLMSKEMVSWKKEHQELLLELSKTN